MTGRAFYFLLGVALIYYGIKSIYLFRKSLKSAENDDSKNEEGLIWNLLFFLPGWIPRNGGVISAIASVFGIVLGFLFLVSAFFAER